MTTTYTKITKATGTSYVGVGMGAYMFDDPSVSFDANVDFDGAFATNTKVPKATGTSYTKIPKAI